MDLVLPWQYLYATVRVWCDMRTHEQWRLGSKPDVARQTVAVGAQYATDHLLLLDHYIRYTCTPLAAYYLPSRLAHRPGSLVPSSILAC